MESFKVNQVLKNINRHEHPKFYYLVNMLKYVFGEKYSSTDDYIYIKNLYNYYNGKCSIDKVELYAINSNKFYVITPVQEGKEQALTAYNLSEISNVNLKRSIRYSYTYLTLNIKFKCGDNYILDCLEDTFEEEMSVEMSEIISTFFNKIN